LSRNRSWQIPWRARDSFANAENVAIRTGDWCFERRFAQRHGVQDGRKFRFSDERQQAAGGLGLGQIEWRDSLFGFIDHADTSFTGNVISRNLQADLPKVFYTNVDLLVHFKLTLSFIIRLMQVHFSD
jgi:hypothetical protein